MYIIYGLALLIVLMGLFFAGQRLSLSASIIKHPHGLYRQIATPSPFSTPVTSKLSRYQVTQRLSALAVSPEITKLPMGAMCYAPYLYEAHKAIYTCPRCGNRTNYAAEQEETHIVETVIPASRRFISQIESLTLKLDESDFCRACSPAVKAPRLRLIMKYDGSARAHTIDAITDEDLKLLKEFLDGSSTHGDSKGIPTTSLKSHLPQLERILGIKAEEMK